MVEHLNDMALVHGLVRTSQARNGSMGFEVTEQGVEVAAEIELPGAKFEHHAEVQEERHREATANAGPIFDALLRSTPEKDVHAQAFIRNVLKHWLTRRWLSSKQVAALAQIGARHGEFVHERHYVGAALEVWTTSYIEMQKAVPSPHQGGHDEGGLTAPEKNAESERAIGTSRASVKKKVKPL